MALILFVEHHSAFRQAASYLMDQEPDLAVVAQGGSVAEGRQRMAQGGIDAAIVDIPLPDEGAPEMVRDLHEANPSIPVLVMTALEASGWRRGGAAQGGLLQGGHRRRKEARRLRLGCRTLHACPDLLQTELPRL